MLAEIFEQTTITVNNSAPDVVLNLAFNPFVNSSSAGATIPPSLNIHVIGLREYGIDYTSNDTHCFHC